MYYERLQASCARLMLSAMLLACVGPSFAQSILMSERPLYNGLPPGQGVTPVEVDLANLGPDARGTLQVTVGSFSMNYPVELPQGARKRLVTYPDSGDYGSGPVQFQLLTNRGRLRQTLESQSEGYYQGQVYGEISQTPGDLEFLRAKQQSRDSNGYQYGGIPQPAYLIPSDAPDRPVGYQRLAALILGDGSERLSDDAVRAIQTWVLQGGSLVFTGGASAPILNDPRWSSLIPVRNARPKNYNGSKSLEDRYGSDPGKFTAMVGDPEPEATARAGGLILERPVGLGRAIYIAFDPFADPMNTWDSRQKMFDEVLSPGLLAGPNMAISAIVNPQSSRFYSGYSYPTPYGGPSSGYMGNVANNPFRAQLPGTSSVLGILCIYFLAVVPINFVVLRKLKRGELAWVTAPLLSLGFAGLFFESARGLYGAKMSTSGNGLVIAQAGQSDGIVIGHSQLFFPSGGRYDLKLSAIDSISSMGANPYSYGSANHSIYEDIDPVDSGEIQSSISVPSLAFREFTFRQKVGAGNWFEVHRLPNGHFMVVNKSPFKLLKARLAGGGGWVSVGDLAPNATTEVAFKGVGTSDDFAGRLGRLLIRSKGLAVTGLMPDFRPGPQVGSEVDDAGGYTLAFVANELLKDNEIRADLKDRGESQ